MIKPPPRNPLFLENPYKERRARPVIHMNREQCFLSEVRRFSQNSVYLRCATCLPQIITNDRALKFTGPDGGSHADNRGASCSEARGGMWTNTTKAKRSNIYRSALVDLQPLARLMGNISE